MGVFHNNYSEYNLEKQRNSQIDIELTEICNLTP